MVWLFFYADYLNLKINSFQKGWDYVFLIEPNDNTNMVKFRLSTDDKPNDNTNVVKSKWSGKEKLENATILVKSRWSSEERGNKLEPDGEIEDEGVLTIQKGPMTCARSKKLMKAVSGMFRSVWEQKESHGQK